MRKAIPIWQPKYKDNKVLVACSKVKNGKNYIFFCIDDNYPNLYSFDGEEAINNYDIVYNSKIYCYAVPIEKLVDCGELPYDFVEQKEKEQIKYRKRMCIC